MCGQNQQLLHYTVYRGKQKRRGCTPGHGICIRVQGSLSHRQQAPQVCSHSLRATPLSAHLKGLPAVRTSSRSTSGLWAWIYASSSAVASIFTTGGGGRIRTEAGSLRAPGHRGTHDRRLMKNDLSFTSDSTISEILIKFLKITPKTDYSLVLQ